MRRRLEVGGEFCVSEQSLRSLTINNTIPNWLHVGDDNKLLMSGRSAIDYVLQDIGNTSRTVYFPSYCCYSMLQPFINRGYAVQFYSVEYSESGLHAHMNCEQKSDILFVCNYFGLCDVVCESVIEQFQKRGTIVIADLTHSLFNSTPSKYDYAIASIRKWCSIGGGAVASKNRGYFRNSEFIQCDYIEGKYNAMVAKDKYLSYINDDKLFFLDLFAEFNKKLSKQYENIEIDTVSVSLINTLDVVSLTNKRKINSSILLEFIQENNYYKLLCSPDESGFVPLFIPIYVPYGLRDELKKELIISDIYSPSHWPKSPYVTSSNSDDIYQNELSLICDQRYSANDMQRIVTVLKQFAQNNK